MVVCCFSMQQKEDVYHATIKKYTQEELSLFSEAFASMVLWMVAHPLEDPFARYFQQYISHGHNGQFFTPDPLANLMAGIVSPMSSGSRVLDPSCGSGSLILSAARVNRDQEFFGCDISLTCCLMTLINMCLNDLVGEVYHMDTLSRNIWHAWRVCRLPITRHFYIQELTIVDTPVPEPAAAPEQGTGQTLNGPTK